jgi:hypothetical protein
MISSSSFAPPACSFPFSPNLHFVLLPGSRRAWASSTFILLTIGFMAQNLLARFGRRSGLQSMPQFRVFLAQRWT